MKIGDSYDVKPFDLHGLVGISDRTLEMHLKLYEGQDLSGHQTRVRRGDSKLQRDFIGHRMSP